MMRILFMLARLAYGAVFVYAGASKMADASTFAGIIANYQILPAKLIFGAALLLPALEVVCGLALWVNSLARGAAVILNCLMAAFLVVMGWAWHKGLDVTCGCFGGAGQTISRETLLRDAAILALGLVAMWGAFSVRKDNRLSLRGVL